MFAKSALLLTLSGSALAQLMVQTPASLIQCQPALLSWSGDKTPVFLAVIPGGQSGAAALEDFGSQSGNSYTWKVDIAAGTSISLKVTDSTGTINYSQAVTIQPGSDDSCLNSGGAASGVAGGASGSGAAAGGATNGTMPTMTGAAMGATGTAPAAGMASGMSSGMPASSGPASSVKAAAAGGDASGTSSASSGTMTGGSKATMTTTHSASASASSGAAYALQADVKKGALAVLIGAMGLAWL